MIGIIHASEGACVRVLLGDVPHRQEALPHRARHADP